MRQWLIIQISNFVRALAGVREDEHVKVEETPEPDVCPICGMDWEKGEIFCFNCGYELKDRFLPLFPPPERTGVLVDPDRVLDDSTAQKVREKLSKVARERSLDLVLFILPAQIRNRMRENSKTESLAGLAFCLYNTWQMGKDTGLKGLLLALDPAGHERALVTGRNGPKITGKQFREWYAALHGSGGFAGSLADELEFVADRIEEELTKQTASKPGPQ